VTFSDFRVVDFSTAIAGPYCTKMLVDAGAAVVKIEPPDGDPLRRWQLTPDIAEGDSALFQYLAAGKRSVRGAIVDDHVHQFVRGADLVVESGELSVDDIERIRSELPGTDILSISPFGRRGPWAERPATDFTLQALAGSMAIRGPAGREPLQAGGRLGEWIGGSFAAAIAMALQVGATTRKRGGEWADVSIHEAMCTAMALYQPVTAVLSGKPGRPTPRTVEIPSIHPALDGYVGFCTITAQMFQDFLVMIDEPGLLADNSILDVRARQDRYAEFKEIVDRWTSEMPAEAIEEIASALRIPYSPVETPTTITQNKHFVDRKVFIRNAGGFAQPRRPYLIDGHCPPSVGAAPLLGEHDGATPWTRRSQPASALNDSAPAPLSGVRILDLTAFWAGPAATQVMAGMGAQVIKVESIQKPDGMRFTSTRTPSEAHWWEAGGVFQGANANKLGITLNLGSPEGIDALEKLIRRADVVIENFSPRVMDNFGLPWDRVHELNPSAVYVRMPAFGLSGPWRDRTGFAQTMEQATGLAWMTGYADGDPTVLQGPSDPVAGLHAVVATLVALQKARTENKGKFVEVPMVESALNVAAEVVIENSAYGTTPARIGNRHPHTAPQGVYRCRNDQWLAIAVPDDICWVAAVTILDIAPDDLTPAHRTTAGRRADSDHLDAVLAKCCATKCADEVTQALISAGVPAAVVIDPSRVLDNEHLRARRFAEKLSHPVLGEFAIPGLPVTFASHVRPAFSTPAPMLGQHNDAVLTTIAGFDRDELDELEKRNVIGDRPNHL
jgi:crotonobetainyl-CoA:carnitine CoA-transferase CaiB-like acyl-CoA transferase